MRGLCAALLALLGLADSALPVDEEAARSQAAAALVYASLVRQSPVPSLDPPPPKPAAGSSTKVFAPPKQPPASPHHSAAPADRRPRLRLFRRR